VRFDNFRNSTAHAVLYAGADQPIAVTLESATGTSAARFDASPTTMVGRGSADRIAAPRVRLCR
jgi:hypothetical protein